MASNLLQCSNKVYCTCDSDGLDPTSDASNLVEPNSDGLQSNAILQQRALFNIVHAFRLIDAGNRPNRLM